MWLDVSTSGYYAWRHRQESQRAKEDKHLLKLIMRIFTQSQTRYGSPRVFQVLKQQGVAIGRKRVERLMREAGLKARCTRVVRRTPKLKQFQQAGANVLLTLSQPTSMNQVWVGDVTYLKLNGQWQYLATVMDVYSRRIIGWSLSKHRRSELTIHALSYALKRRRYPKGVVFHSDRGIEYLSYEYRHFLIKHDLRQSFNRAYHCTDNAFMESFYHTLKGELIRQSYYKTVTQLRQALSTYINGFYNKTRLHSSIGYVSPIQYEQQAT